MTDSEFEKILLDYTKQQISRLEKLLSSSTNEIARLLELELENADKTGKRLDQINEIYNDMDSIFAGFISGTIKQSFKLSYSSVYELLEKKNTGLIPTDSKTITVLIQDAIRDFTNATANGREGMEFFFKISKQELISESQISELIANKLLDGEYGSKAKNAVKELLKSKNSIVYDKNSLLKRIAKDNKDDLKKVLPELKKDVLNKMYDENYADKKYLQIVNKNGDIMNFQADTYASLVARSRIGDAQVLGAIESGQASGIEFFKVTSHNTQSAICKPHESKTYTTSQKIASLGVWKFLSSSNRPIYHPNCQHRLFPVPYSESQIRKIAERNGLTKSQLDEVFN
jgi:hypothetical protein